LTLAFVAGSTGYTGREVVRVLRARNLETVAHVRPDSPHLPEWRTRFEGLGARVDTTPWDAALMTLKLAALRPDTVFSLLGTTRKRAKQAAAHGGDEGYEAVDYGLTMLLLNAAKACGSKPRFVYLSSVGVTENTRNAYLAVRARVERVLRGEGDLPYTIARPSFITGSDRDEFRPGERITAKVVDAALVLAGWLGARQVRDRYRSTTNVILANALIRIAVDPALVNTVVESEDLR
jgi:nucleoside-diphosphate-sugar epimerase